MVKSIVVTISVLVLFVVFFKGVSASTDEYEARFYVVSNSSTGDNLVEPGEDFTIELFILTTDPLSFTFYIPLPDGPVEQTSFTQSDNVTGTWRIENNMYIFQGVVQPNEFGGTVGVTFLAVKTAIVTYEGILEIDDELIEFNLLTIYIQGVADLSITLSPLPDSLKVGDRVTVEMTISNLGLDLATQLSAQFMISPTRLITDVAIDAHDGNVLPVLPNILWSLGNLPSGEQETMSVVFTLVEAGTLHLQGQVTLFSSSGIDPVSDNNQFNLDIFIHERSVIYLPITNK